MRISPFSWATVTALVPECHLSASNVVGQDSHPDARMAVICGYDFEDANTPITDVRHYVHGWELASNGRSKRLILHVREVSECWRVRAVTVSPN